MKFISYVMVPRYYLFFGNFANPLKIKILNELKKKERSVLELSRLLKEEQSKISHALKSLKNCSIVKSEKKGKKRIYSLNKETVLPILNIVDKHEEKFCEECIAVKCRRK